MAWSYEIQVGGYWAFDDPRGLANAEEVWTYLYAQGFTLESVCGILGNMWRESHLNPGQKQSTSTSSGWGLIQWTPSTALTNYVTNWYDGAEQIEVVYKEMFLISPFSGRWLKTSSYPYTGLQFSQLTDVEESTRAYLAERERAGVEAVSERIEYAKKYYEYLSGQPYPTTNILWLPGALNSLKRRKYLT